MNGTLALAPRFKYGARRFSDVGVKRGRYTSHSRDYVHRFYKLVREWRADTAYSSSPTELLNHDAFRQIVQMGAIVVPLIIREINRQPDFLVAALVRITGENPVSEADRGDLYAMAVAWNEWFSRRK